MDDEKMEKLVSLSKFMRWLCLALIIALAVVGVAVALVGALTGADWFFDQLANMSQTSGVPFSPDKVGIASRLIIVVINGVTIFFTCRGLWFLMQLFTAFSAREVLTIRTSQLLRSAGFSFLVVAIYGVLARTLSVLFLTLGNPAGRKQLSIGFGSEQLLGILLAGTLFAIGHALSIAAAIQEENKGFI